MEANQPPEDDRVADALVEEYDQTLHLYAAFTSKVSDLIVEILEEHGIHVHSVTHRVKNRDSLVKKLARPDGQYSGLSEVTDIAGIRITTYFEDDVDRVAEIIEREFRVDKENSVDKRELLDPDRFGYLSMHHVLSLSTERCRLTEYKRFPKLKAEVQTRSILQHAWAEIEHDLGYKSSQEIPQSIRRRFSRLAGLLELADQEFTSIKRELSDYEQRVLGRIEKAPQLVTIDKASLAAFVLNSDLVGRLDKQIAGLTGGNAITYLDANIARHVKRLQVLGIETISDLEKILGQHSQDLIGFARVWLGESRHSQFSSGVCLFYLGYVLVAITKDPSRIMDYFDQMRIGGRSESLVKRVMETYEASQEK